MASHNSSNANRLAGRPSDDYSRSDTDDVLAGVREIRGVGLSAGIKCYNPNGGRNYHVIQKDDGRMYITDETAATVLLGMDKDRIDFRNNELWHAGNDGEGSGLDADTVRGQTPADLGASGTQSTRETTGRQSGTLMPVVNWDRYTDHHDHGNGFHVTGVYEELQFDERGGSQENITVYYADGSKTTGTVAANGTTWLSLDASKAVVCASVSGIDVYLSGVNQVITSGHAHDI